METALIRARGRVLRIRCTIMVSLRELCSGDAKLKTHKAKMERTFTVTDQTCLLAGSTTGETSPATDDLVISLTGSSLSPVSVHMCFGKGSSSDE